MYLSDLLGNSIEDEQGQRMGRLRDIVVSVNGADPPPVVGIVTQRDSTAMFLAIEHVARFQAGAAIIVVPNPPWQAFQRRARQAMLGGDIMDSQVIDVHETRMVRVNDVLIDETARNWHVTGIDIGMQTLVRRLMPRVLRGGHGSGAGAGADADAGRTLSWAGLELLSSEMPGSRIEPDHQRLAQLHPADIARVADVLPARQSAELVAALDDAIAADTLEEMIDEKQADVIEMLDIDRAAGILEHMAPDAAADVLAELEPDLVDGVLQRMKPAEAGDVHALLTYPKDTAGGLMTTDLVLAPRELTVGEAPTYLRPQLENPDWVYYVYVVDDMRERKLAGVFSLRDLLLAEPAQRVDEIMTMAPRHVPPDAPATSVAQMMSEYNLMAMPVTDNDGRLLGIVSVDDALETILPNELRRRLPRVFS